MKVFSCTISTYIIYFVLGIILYLIVEYFTGVKRFLYLATFKKSAQLGRANTNMDSTDIFVLIAGWPVWIFLIIVSSLYMYLKFILNVLWERIVEFIRRRT